MLLRKHKPGNFAPAGPEGLGCNGGMAARPNDHNVFFHEQLYYKQKRGNVKFGRVGWRLRASGSSLQPPASSLIPKREYPFLWKPAKYYNIVIVLDLWAAALRMI
jgi:hypothetical protein